MTRLVHNLEKKPVIEFRDFSFQYRAQSAPTLHHIDLTIFEGEKVLILGPSGSGKSTLAHCINGLVPFFYPGETTGSLKINGLETAELDIHRLSGHVGTVLQDPDGQFVGLTAAEDIAFKLENKAVPLADMVASVKRAADAVGMSGRLGASPHALSGGQKQRTTLAGVLTDDVGILLFDEPLANLDPATGQSAMELIDELQRQTGKTVVIIEHRLEDVLHAPVDRIVLLDDGRIVADMTPAELLSSKLLAETGIREPLWLTALRYAGCEIHPAMRPESIRALQLADSDIRRLHDWNGSFQPAAGQTQGPPLLELDDISFAYEDGPPVLEHISLTVAKGEMVGIVGQNGAGKSTLSRIICGFHKPLSGRIFLGGRDIGQDTIRERAERIGYVMQNPNQMISKPLLYEEVAFGLQVRGVPLAEQQERVHRVLRVCGLYEMRNWPISALSFGQKKRVTIASILVLEPDILILDEPTAGQDFRHYNEMMEFLLELGKSGVTIIMITHDMHLLLEYASRAIVLAGGRKLADGAPADLLTDDEIVAAAALKKTSVFALAERAGCRDPHQFVHRFIDCDRRMREQ